MSKNSYNVIFTEREVCDLAVLLSEVFLVPGYSESRLKQSIRQIGNRIFREAKTFANPEERFLHIARHGETCSCSEGLAMNCLYCAAKQLCEDKIKSLQIALGEYYDQD